MDLQARVAAGYARLVAAINAVDTKVEAIPESAVINDGVTNGSTVWSSTKTQAQINAAAAALIGGAGPADDTLSEIAAQIVANASNDAGHVSFAGAQVLTQPQKAQACSNIGIGDPDTDFTTAIVAALNAGL
jgi:hypothetical protein